MKNMCNYEFCEAIDAVMTRNRESRPCDTSVPTGFRDIDKIIKGFQPSELTIIAGRPAMGKTQFWINAVSHIAFKLDMSVGIFLAKEVIHNVVNMFISQDSHVNITHIETGRLDKEELGEIEMSAVRLSEGKITISTPNCSFGKFDFNDLYSGIKQLIETYCIDLIVVDSLQDITIDNDCDQDKYIEIVKCLREVAIMFQVPIVLISSLPAEIDMRKMHFPTIDDLRAYGHIDSYAETIILVYRDDYYDSDSSKSSIAEFEIVKGGSSYSDSRAELMWIPQFLKFANLDK